MKCVTKRNKHAIMTITIVMMAYLPPASSQTTADYHFDNTLLLGSRLAGGELERFNMVDQIDPGQYRVDIFLNGRFTMRHTIAFRRVAGSTQVTPCFTEEFLGSKLATKVVSVPGTDNDACPALDTLLPGSTARFDMSKMRLDMTVPNSLLDKTPDGYINPEQWDKGVTMMFVNYDVNVYRSRYMAMSGSHSDYAYIGFDTGLNLGLWRLRHQSNVSYSAFNGKSNVDRNRIRTYAQRAVPSLKSELIVGESYTDGQLLGSMGFRGVRIKSDDRMLPDSQRQYAPEVRGTANTAARVIIRQNGEIIRELTVAPGPFIIDDLYGTAYNGDLNVEVLEADGTASTFTVPFSAVPESIRPGMTRYSVTLGQARQYGDGKDWFMDTTYQHGVSNKLTMNLGSRFANNYLSLLAGGVVSSTWGALGANATFSSATVANNEHQKGWRVGLNYSRTFSATDTAFTLAGYRYSTAGYRTLGDVLGARSANDKGTDWDSSSYKQRNQFTLLINQNLGSYGSLYFSGSRNDYYAGKKRDNQFQMGYANTWGRLSYNISFSRQRSIDYPNINSANESTNPNWFNGMRESTMNNTINLTITIPLGTSNNSPTLNAMASRHAGDAHGTNMQAGLSGTLGEDRSMSYSVSANRDSAMQGTHGNATIQKRTPIASLSAGYARSRHYRQVNGGMRGAAVLHSGGLTLGPHISETFALVEAQGAKGARVRGSQGSRIDGNGYALVPSLSPYRYNSVFLDPQGIVSDTELLETERRVVPFAGAAIRMRFNTLGGKALLVKATLPDGSALPLGAKVATPDNQEIGIVGQGGQIYARVPRTRGQLHVIWGADSSDRCTLDYDITGAAPDLSLIHLKGVCINTPDTLAAKELQ